MTLRRACSPILLLLWAPVLVAQDRAAFDRGLAEVHRLMSSGEWPTADASLRVLLQENEGADYAVRMRSQLIEDLKRSRFYCANPPPHAQELIAGEIVRYNGASGRMVLRYTPDRLGDFSTQSSGVLLHPARFRGAHTIAITGDSYPRTEAGMRVLVCVSAGVAYEVVFGYPPAAGQRRYVPASIYRLAAGERKQLALLDRSPVTAGARFDIRVAVSADSIVASYNGQPILRARKLDGGFGRFGFQRQPFGELAIDGEIEPAWLQGLVDKQMQGARLDFDRRWNEAREVPAWLRESEPAPSAGKVGYGEWVYPGKLTDRQLQFFRETLQLLQTGQTDAAAARLAAATRHDGPRGALAYLRAAAAQRLGRIEDAVEQIDLALAAEDDFWPAHELRSRLMIELRDASGAEAELRAALELAPAQALLYRQLALLMLEQSRVAEATDLLDQAAANGARGKPLDELARMLSMAVQGPAFRVRYEHKSRHYHVVSDIDESLCVRAAKLLEDAYVMFQSDLAWVSEGGDSQRFRVFLFSGEAGYTEYCRQILGQVRVHSAGLYSPTLKQLLIWNLPQRDEMLRTVRHEGFHQYLDRVVSSAPAWFNEGLAEFYESAHRERGRVVSGPPRQQHLAVLRRLGGRLMPLTELLYMPANQFYELADMMYAQSWAFVQFLRESNRGNAALFRTIFEQLRSPGSSRQALGAALAGVDLAALERQFRSHVAALIE